MLEIKSGSFGYQSKKKKKVILDGISFQLRQGDLLCILGANGVGKTTMYRSILGFMPVLNGEILLDGINIKTMSREQLAKKIAYVPQYHTPPFPYSVFDVVLMGRGTHISHFAEPGKKDEMIVCETLERMGIFHLKDEIYTEISGGERQLVLIARALVQQTNYILMDEPTSNLDFGNQIHLLKVIKQLTEEGIGICFTTHYPDQAFLTDSTVLALEGKTEWQIGKSGEVITEQLLKRMYGVDVKIQKLSGKNGEKSNRIVVDEIGFKIS